MKYQIPYIPSYKPLSLILLSLGFSSLGWGEKTPRFNTFRIVSIQAGSTTDIDDLKVIDLDTDQVVYQNNFSTAGDAKRDLNLFYYPQGGKDTTDFSVDDQKNRIVSGKLRLETTGYRANGRGGYNSHSDAEFSGGLPPNFLVEFHATRLQWAGHFFFQVFYKDPSDSLSSHELGGAFSTQRKSEYRNDYLQFHGEGSWFNEMSLVVPGVGTPVKFPAPKINLQNGHRLGISLNGSIVGFHVDGKLLNSGEVSDYIKEVEEDTTILPIDDVPFTTIQNAIDIAQEGDVVRVPSGTYVENLNFGSKQIVLESISGPAHTILQAADKLNSVVILNGATIRGFTITGGTGKPAKSSYGFDYYGGGINARGESVIERCIITGNGKGVARKSAGTFAGGVYAGSGSKITLRDSLLYDNYAWACGGALLVDHGANMKIENCTIFGNDSTNFFGHQGGVGMANGGKVQIKNSIIWGNSGDEIGAFASIYARGTQATVSHSLIEGGVTGTGNLKVSNPGFVNQNNPKGLDGILGTVDDGLHPTSKSPLIGKAWNDLNGDLSQTDICGFLRVQGEEMDMGCYEFGNELPQKEENPTDSDSNTKTSEDIIADFDLRMVEIDSKGPVVLGYPKYDEVEVSLTKYNISGETVTFGTWTKVREAAEKELGWKLAEGVQGSGYDDTNELHPVTKIGFWETILWCNALSKLAGLEPCYLVENSDGQNSIFEPALLNDAKSGGIHLNSEANGIRVPTGNEWEVAARGGLVGKKFPWGNEYPGNTRANWYVGNGMPNSTTEVGSYPENGYGLFDMAGGVWEMTWDDALQPDEETPLVLSDTYVNRGGAWNAGWSPEVSTNGWSIRFGDRRHEFGFRVAANGASTGKAPPPIGPPTGPPEPLVDYIKLLREIIEEIAGVETELIGLVRRGGEKDAEIEKLEGELVSITGQINKARTQLAECLDDCNRTRKEIAQVQKETLSQNLEIARLGGELRSSADRLNDLKIDRDKVTAQITEIEEQMKAVVVKMSTAHTPGWHYVPVYGWLWTSPEHYPLIYSNDREGWVYYERGTSDPWLYFDYNSEKWEKWFHDAPLFSSSN